MPKAIFVGGTASHVGKSWFTTAVCRHLYQRGLRVAPFKAQNMSNNSYPCPQGGEIGRAQVAQAEACGLEPHPDFNPILLKPSADSTSQVVLNGRMWMTLPAREYYEHFPELLEHVLAAYDRLSHRFDYIVIEGAGSVAELNFADRDLVNLGFARRVDAAGLLVGDIERGGIFASILGTYCLLSPEDKARMRMFAVNRFRGDRSLFTDGARILEQRSGKPCLGVFPFAHDIHVDEEDGHYARGVKTSSTTAIIALPRISNITDFRLLPDAAWIKAPVDHDYQTIILPGTKATLADLRWMREQGLDGWIIRQHLRGARIVGICGGYQMLGRRIEDPHGIESDERGAPGLDLLPVETTMAPEKTTRAVMATLGRGIRFRAYEIHVGETRVLGNVEPFAWVEGRREGARLRNVIGTYLHGALEDHRVLSDLLGRTVAPPRSKQADYDALAKWFQQHADIARFEETYL